MQLFPLKIFPSNTNFDFMRVKNLNYALSVFLFILSLVWIGIYKFNFGIDFAGGISMELRINQTPDLAKMRMILNELNIGEIEAFLKQPLPELEKNPVVSRIICSIKDATYRHL